MASVIPIILGALLITGSIGAIWQLWSARPAPRGSAALPADAGAVRVAALAKLAWVLFLLFHSVFLLVLSESREVPEVLSIGASLGGALTFLAALVALLSCISLERRLYSNG